LGYWADPEATAAVLDDHGWYRTGDLGVVRDGRVYLAGRRRDVIIRGGENIYPVEIENRLVEHSDVVDAAVVGVEHRTLGQEPHAFVVVRPESSVTAADLQAWVAERLAPFKVPVRVERREDLPRNPSGKVMKHLLVTGDPSPFVEE
ncbi:MAG: class I adenylate-forming enzyme family protein, partial [Acidimicrobiales bacterium]